ncbi:M1 family aminopeptidase [Massilia sp. CF038]|uniref:M1 family aminopeptidase n=1 Tax=Massilia sp. CF038 TaxID=1881045 RepID=UPI00091F89AA|nr:M1 family aminopeptidase [Massilia sp. CF038]SHG65257.1 Peptidase family M1 [Massilia sp. CF038]
MWREFFKFDLAFQLRQPLLWVCALVMALMAFGASTSDAVQVGGAIGNINRNAPLVVARLLGAFSVLSMLVVTMFIAGAVLRDHEVGISDMLFATPMRKIDYLFGRFAAGLVACVIIFLVVMVGIMAGPLMPWVETARVGPFPAAAYLWTLTVLILPNLLFIGALLMLLAATTRSMMMVYVGVLGFIVLWIVGGAFTRDINSVWPAVLLDPFGMRALERMTRYFSTAEANTALPPFGSYLLANRALWTSIALAMFAATVILFKPQRSGTGKRLFGKQRAVHVPPPAQAAPVRLHPPRAPRFGAATGPLQCWHIFQFDTLAVIKSVPFLIMLLFAVLNLVGSSIDMSTMFGTPVYPMTHLMLTQMNSTFNFMLIIIVIFYAGELIFKERQARVADVGDAMPVPDWAPLVAKCGAMLAVIAGFLLVGVLTSIVIQLLKGGAPVEVLLYAKGSLLTLTNYFLMGMIFLALQVLSNSKFIGYLLAIVFVCAQMVMSALDLEHNLYLIGGLPAIRYSDMNGYGHFVEGWSWFAAYWSLFVLGLLIVARAFWVRGLAGAWRARLQAAQRHLRGPAGMALAACVVGFAASGAWIFHNTNQLNRYEAKDEGFDLQARYEKLYRKYKGLPQPKITDVKADVDIYPDQRQLKVRASYQVQNKTTAPIDTLRFQTNPDVTVRWTNLPPHQVLLDDQTARFSILKLATPIAPGASLRLDFTLDVQRRGFTSSGQPDVYNLNGTFFNNMEVFPHLGYQSGLELTDRNERRKRGLGEPERVPKLEDQAARANHQLGAEADWINFETTVSTAADQIALAPGYLQKSWVRDGRRYFQYKMDQKMMPFFAYLSARWEVKKGEWHGIPIEIYYDRKHPYNVERMIGATKKSLDYMTANFTPYQHKQVRIMEFPNYQRFAQAFANTIPYSESIGFIADMRKADAIDYVFYVTAHEMAHQWWAHQVVGANVQGGTMLVESLAQYSALMVMEKEYGRDKLRRFLKYELDRYLQGRGGELLDEQPLYRVENQEYVHYAKGSLVFYRLRDEIGEAALNRALKRFLEDKRFKDGPYPTSAELLTYIRAEAPADKQALITDLFEKIVFYDNRVTEAKAVKRADGKWDVTFQLHLAKLEFDGKGKESARLYDEPVDIAIFARAPGAKEQDERVLYAAKRRFDGATPSVTVTVDAKPFEVGVDPYNKMIDRVSNDNRKEVSIE